MNKKQIVIMAGIGLIFFALSFTVGLFTRKSAEPDANNQANAGPEVIKPFSTNNDAGNILDGGEGNENSYEAQQAELNKSLTEKQLKDLIFEMRTKLADLTVKEKKLEEKDEHIQMSMKELQGNIKELEDLRMKLMAQLSSIKAQQKLLDDKLITIGASEKKNIIKLAAVYDKRKAPQACKTIVNLYKSNQLDYAVKLTYYMSERASSKLLDEMSNQQPELAALISDKLRWIEEKNE